MAAVLAACAGSGSDGADVSGGPSTTAGGTTTAPTTTTVVPTTLPPATVVSCPSIPERLPPDPDRPRYRLDLSIGPDGSAGTWVVKGTTEVRFVPDLPTDRLVFRLWPNGPRQAAQGTRLETGTVRVDGQELAAELEQPTMLVVPLGRTIEAGQAVTATVPWTLHPPSRARDRISAEGESLRLGSFMPLLEWTRGVGWTTDPPTTMFHEAGAAPVADFDITISVPEGYDVIASGVPDGAGHWTATAMRDVAVAVGRFTMATATAMAPHPVEVTVGVAPGIGESPQLYLDNAVEVLEDFGRRFGPYAWDTFAVSVTPTITSGIEYPAHVLHGPGTSGATLSHEVGHQWFYALVGNNQAHTPWMDEGMSTWAESRADGTTAAYLARGIPAGAQGNLGQPIPFWDTRSSIFYVGTYVQGAQALGALGEPDLVDCALRVFVAQNAHRIATPADFVAAASAVFPDAAATLAGYGITP